MITPPLFLNDSSLIVITTLLLYLVVYNIALCLLFSTALSKPHQPDSTNLFLLSSRNTIQNLFLLIAFLSLAGIPPISGFFTKLLLITLLLNEFFLFWFAIVTPILLFGMFFYLSNLRHLLSYDALSREVRPYLNSPFSLPLVLSASLLSGGILFDELITLILWLLI